MLRYTVLLFACLTFGLAQPARSEREAEGIPIHTVLPQDAIPAIFDPEFVPAPEADVHKDAPMIGVSIAGEHHAYSMYLLNRHEIVNDAIGGDPIATTW